MTSTLRCDRDVDCGLGPLHLGCVGMVSRAVELAVSDSVVNGLTA
jgi:hypothetical protein